MKTGLLHLVSISWGPSRPRSQRPRESVPVRLLGALHHRAEHRLEASEASKSLRRHKQDHGCTSQVSFSEKKQNLDVQMLMRRRALTGGSSGARSPWGRAAGAGSSVLPRCPQGLPLPALLGRVPVCLPPQRQTAFPINAASHSEAPPAPAEPQSSLPTQAEGAWCPNTHRNCACPTGLDLLSRWTSEFSRTSAHAFCEAALISVGQLFFLSDTKAFNNIPRLKPCKPTLATWCEEPTHLKRPWCWGRLKAGGEGDARGWDGWMASPTRWTRVE